MFVEYGTAFLKKVSSWYENRKVYEDIAFYASREEAMRENEFIDIEQIEAEE